MKLFIFHDGVGPIFISAERESIAKAMVKQHFTKFYFSKVITDQAKIKKLSKGHKIHEVVWCNSCSRRNYPGHVAEPIKHPDTGQCPRCLSNTQSRFAKPMPVYGEIDLEKWRGIAKVCFGLPATKRQAAKAIRRGLITQQKVRCE